MVGVVLGLAGALVVITKGGNVGLANGVMPGHVIALFCAFVWSGYSVLSRRFGKVPTDVVAGYCFITAIVAFALHLLLETTVWPQTLTQWTAICVLGAVPLGAGFYAWDYGCKHGDIMILGALSYAAPLFSVIVLLLAGFGVFHWSVALACILIMAGAVIAAKDVLFRRGQTVEAEALRSASS
jgi:drug/metabolite transporter (DMT)-like permease